MNRSLTAIMFSCAVFCAGLLASSSHLRAQTATPASPRSVAGADYDNRVDVFGGFSYSHFTTTGGHGLKTDLLGAGGQATAWLNPRAGVAATLRYVSGSLPIVANTAGITNPRISETLFMFGPDFRILHNQRWALGGHVLIGGTYGIFDSDLKGAAPDTVGLYNNQLAFAAAAGATVDYNLSSKISIRAYTDFQPTFFGIAKQKEFAGQVGVVYKLGSLHAK